MERRERARKIVQWLIYNHVADSQHDLANKMGYNATVLSAALTGKIPFSDKLSRNLARMDERIDLDWLLNGEDDDEAMYERGSQPSSQPSWQASSEVSTQASSQVSTQPSSQVSSAVGAKVGRTVHEVPFYRQLPATAGSAEQYGYDAEADSMRIPGVTVEACFPVSGHSMEPYIQDGDMVGVVSMERDERIHPDRTYLVITRNNERMVKHICPPSPGDTTLTLQSDNPAYRPFEVDKQDVLRIMRVVFSGRTYK